MRGLVVATALSSALITCPAFAQESGFYAGGELGAVLSAGTDQQYTPASAPGTTGNISTDHDLGFEGAAFAGYKFGGIRIEVEAGYLSAGIDKLQSNFSGGFMTAGSQSADGDVNAQTIMGNATIDVGGFSDFTFFVGAGAGVAKTKISKMEISSGQTVLDDEDRDWLFAWQGIAGVRKPLTSNIDAHVRYRYFRVDEAEMVGFSGRVVTADFDAHTLSAGVTFNF